MTVESLAKALDCRVVSGSEDVLSRKVEGGYVGDLLSWVMGRAGADNAWITIMQNMNVAAVALLADVACVILAEDVTPDDALLARAQQQDVALLCSPLSAFELAWRVKDTLG